ncbi:glycosyltransferase family 4 protein [Thiocapsa bogorovii]|uniref:glycosyltransferase family 4 protein n=1 Tax=Thiocapsa bogorovii TaxID=521689 RepID=UPI001E29F4EA|nr:glycosyltransferase family 4 protein [Thiocapsa bogorovii]UHD16879.1 glycosyltransferase family 4 protein [Thiocapsa bogorovii]
MPRPKPRLLVLTSTFPRWRDDVEPPFVFELSRRLTDAFDITVLTPRSPGSLERETLDGLRVVRFPYFLRSRENLASHGGGILNRLRANPLNYLLVPPFLIGQLWALVRVLRDDEWDLIHAHWLIPQGLVALLARKLARRPVALVCTSHGGDLFALRGSVFRAIKRAVLHESTRVSVVSEAMRDAVIALGIAPEKIAVIPMGVDLRERFTPDPRIPREKNQLLFVGRLVEKKGMGLLFTALPRVLRAFPDTRLTIAGGGPLESELRQLAASLRISDHVDFKGMVPQSDLPALYRRAILFVAPFLVADSGDQEGFGLVLVEAMGCGCPVICGDVPAVRDIVLDENTGFLVNPRNPVELADAIVELLADPIRRDRYAVNARDHCAEAFDWGTIALRYGVLLSEPLNEDPEKT